MNVDQFSAAFNIIKSLLPPKAVASLRFVNSKNLNDYITEDNMLKCWGGTDDHHFKFEPEKSVRRDFSCNNEHGSILSKDENDNTTTVRKV